MDDKLKTINEDINEAMLIFSIACAEATANYKKATEEMLEQFKHIK